MRVLESFLAGPVEGPERLVPFEHDAVSGGGSDQVFGLGVGGGGVGQAGATVQSGRVICLVG
jgi:hypothetical protein